MKIQPRLITAHNGTAQRILPQQHCALLEKCGSCALLDQPYKQQLQEKSLLLKSLVQKAGAEFSDIIINDCSAADELLGYRQSVKLIVSEDANLGPQKRWIKLGFYRQSLNDVIDIGRCPVQSNTLNDLIAWIRGGIRVHNISVYTAQNKTGILQSITIRASKETKQVLVVFSVSRADLSLLRPIARQMLEKFSNVQGVFTQTTSESLPALLAGQDLIEEKYGDYTLKFSAVNQMPMNPHMHQKLSSRVAELADLSGKETALSLCSEFNLVPFMLAQSARFVHAVGMTMHYKLDGLRNAQKNKIKNIDFYENNFLSEESASLWQHISNASSQNIDVAFLNPPRSGLNQNTIEHILNLNPKTIIYTSSFIETLLQDTKKFIQTGFKAIFLEQYDTLPGTAHYEILCYLKK